MRFKALTGFRDFYPEQMAVRRTIEAAWHRASRNAGFQEFDGPVLESLELLAAKSGPEIETQLYAFEDKGERRVALRPEMTPTLARMVAARAGGLPKPIKWYCVPQLFRYERPQRGRGREFVQWNVDVVGASEASADAEAMAVALDALRILGLSEQDVVLRVNDRGFLRRMLRSIDVEEGDEAEVLGLIDKLVREPAVPQRLEERLGKKRAAEILGWCEQLPLEQAEELGSVLEACRDYGIGAYVEPDFKIVRGLAYYTGPVWEIFDRGGQLRSLAGGGRYDKLIAALGGPDLPALGFGMGDVVLRELLQEKGLEPKTPPRVEVFVIAIGPEMQGPARQVLLRLRKQGVAADAPYGSPKVGKALKAADLAGARRVVLVGPEEWADGAVRVKDMASGEERKLRLEELG